MGIYGIIGGNLALLCVMIGAIYVLIKLVPNIKIRAILIGFVVFSICLNMAKNTTKSISIFNQNNEQSVQQGE